MKKIKIIDIVSLEVTNERARNETFCGYNLIAIDGTTAEIPNTQNLKKSLEKQKHQKHQQVMLEWD